MLHTPTPIQCDVLALVSHQLLPCHPILIHPLFPLAAHARLLESIQLTSTGWHKPVQPTRMWKTSTSRSWSEQQHLSSCAHSTSTGRVQEPSLQVPFNPDNHDCFVHPGLLLDGVGWPKWQFVQLVFDNVPAQLSCECHHK